MMNMLAIGLVLTSLVTASIWSPSAPPPPHHDDHQEVIVKEGHRVVVVEYDKEADGSTKVLISPHEVDGTKDSVTEDDQKPNDNHDEHHHGVFSGPRELVCDSYGKCKHKIASALGKTKEVVTETAHEVSEKAQELEEQAKEAASGAVGQVKETVSGYGEHAKQVGKESKEKLSEKVSEKVGRGGPVGKAKEAVSQGIGKAKKVADDVVSTVKDGASKAKNFDVVDSPIRMGEDIESNVTGKVAEGVEHVKEQAKKSVVGQKTLGEILSKIKELSYDVFWYVLSPNKIDAVAGLVHMLGFSTAYGMCVWVTFVSSYILGRYLPRTQFGMVQSRIYPVYFKAMAYCVGATLLGHLVGQRKEMMMMMIRSNMMEMFHATSLSSALLMVLTNMIFLEPKATKLMYERMKIEKEEGRGIASMAKEKDGVADNHGNPVVVSSTTVVSRPQANAGAVGQDVLKLNEKLKRLNSYSSALNVSTLVVLTWHMAYIGQRLQATRQ